METFKEILLYAFMIIVLSALIALIPYPILTAMILVLLFVIYKKTDKMTEK